MKKNIFAVFVILTLACAAFMSGCEEEIEHQDPGVLVGTWARTDTGNLPIFSIKGDLSFECEVVMPTGTDPEPHAMVTGKLDYTAKDLGYNDYMIRDMKTKDAGPNFTEGNAQLDPALGGFQNLLVTLAPGGNKFEFDTKNQAAKLFFGGTYTKQ